VREGTAVALSDAEPVLISAPNQDKPLELRDLERALVELPAEQRSALLLMGMEGMSYEEVATVLNVPVGTIRSRLSRGRAALRQLMGLDTGEDESELDAEATPRRRLPASTRSEVVAGAPGLRRRALDERERFA
jgi:RNA polymerase sigma-70 factor, ECF subfamily